MVPVTAWFSPWHHSERLAVEPAMRCAVRRISVASMPHSGAARSGGHPAATAATSSNPEVCSPMY
ncbi:MAG: hypothetical protein JWM18_1598 [Chloroflexi bacterium]|nr:hypothetical protein [Chloroflexota bacterium]